MREIVLGITGASGAPYAQALINKIITYNSTLKQEGEGGIGIIKIFLIFSDTAKQVWDVECGDLTEYISSLGENIQVVDNHDFNFKYASGSNILSKFIILPASMGTIGRIAAGLSADLIGRIADVQLKEHRSLVICPRESPLNLIHLKNMTTIMEAGGKIIPCSPSFYNKPKALHQLVESFASRVLESCALISAEDSLRWNNY